MASHLAATLVLEGVDIQEIVLRRDCGDEEVDEADWRDDGAHDAEH